MFVEMVTLKRIRLLHAADLHLGTPFRSLSQQLSADFEGRLRQASAGILAKIVQLAIREQVDVVSIAGDLFDEAETSVAIQYDVWRQFQTLEQAGIRVVLTHGNHDPYMSISLFPWPNNVSVLADGTSARNVRDVFLHIDGRTLQYSGFSYLTRELYGSLAPKFQRHPNADVAIALYHGQIGGGESRHKAYAQASMAELVEHRGFDAWLLGHIHEYSVLHEVNPLVVYPGSPIGRNPSEVGPHGVVIVDIHPDKEMKHQFIPIADVEWIKAVVDLTDVSDFDAAWTAVRNALPAPTSDGMFLVHLHLYGYTPLYAQLNGSDMLQILQEAANSDGLNLSIYRVTSECVPELDLEVWRHSDGYLGELLSIFELSETDGVEGVVDMLTQTWSAEDIRLFHEMMELGGDSLASVLRQARQHVLKSIDPQLESYL